MKAEGDPLVARAKELFYVLGKTGGMKNKKPIESTSAELVRLVENKENWGAALEGKGYKSKAMYMAEFIRLFPMRPRDLHGRKLYRQLDILAKLKIHLAGK